MGPCAIPTTADRAEACCCEPHGPLIVAQGDECIRCGRMPAVTITAKQRKAETRRQDRRVRQQRGITKRNRDGLRRVVIDQAA